MDPIHEIKKELIEVLRVKPSIETLRELFYSRTKVFPHPYSHGDLYTAGTFDDLVNSLDSTSAFEFIEFAVSLALEQTEPDLLETAEFLLLSLIQRTDTTQIPEDIKINLEKLQKHEIKKINDPSKRSLQDIKKWYRIR